MENSLPLHQRPLEVNQQADLFVSRSQVIEALRDVLIAEAVDAFDFQNDCFFYENIREVVADWLSFVCHPKRDLSLGADAPEMELAQ